MFLLPGLFSFELVLSNHKVIDVNVVFATDDNRVSLTVVEQLHWSLMALGRKGLRLGRVLPLRIGTAEQAAHLEGTLLDVAEESVAILQAHLFEVILVLFVSQHRTVLLRELLHLHRLTSYHVVGGDTFAHSFELARTGRALWLLQVLLASDGLYLAEARQRQAVVQVADVTS